MREVILCCFLLIALGTAPTPNHKTHDQLKAFWSYPEHVSAMTLVKTQDGVVRDFGYKAIVDNSLEDVALFYLEKCGVDSESEYHQQMIDSLALNPPMGYAFGTHIGNYSINVHGLPNHVLLTKYNIKKKGCITVSLTMADQNVAINLFEVAED